MEQLKKDKAELRYDYFYVHFNPFIQRHEWGKIEAKAEDYFIEFLNKRNYGDLIPMEFNFLVEKEPDINKQLDTIVTSSYMGIQQEASLSAHIDYDYFYNSSEEDKFVVTVNSILYLLQYWSTYLKIPPNCPLDKIINDYKQHLQNDMLYMEDVSGKLVKYFNPFRISFLEHMLLGIDSTELLFDTDDLEYYLNNNLYKYDFGKSIHELTFSYDIIDFANEDYKEYIGADTKYRYGKDKDLLIVEQFDSELFIYKTKQEQIIFLHKGMLAAINRIPEMRRKPKDFNYNKFYIVIDKLMSEYEDILFPYTINVMEDGYD